MKQNFGPESGKFIGKILLLAREALCLHRGMTLILIRQPVGD
jgi:hypothetical protein